MESNVITYKAKLKPTSYHQRQGVHYEETFSPIAMLKSIRILLDITAHYAYEIWKMNAKMVSLMETYLRKCT